MSKLEISPGRSRPKVWRSAAARRIRALAGNVKDTDAAIEIVASRLLEGVAARPSDLESIASRVDAEIVHDEELLGSGALEKTPIGYRILCSPHQPKVRQRFTIAHEIAHALFETTGPHCPRRGRELEQICDRISAAILIPIDVYHDVVDGAPDIRQLLKLCRTCEASLITVLIRAVDLSLGFSAAYFSDNEPAPRLFGQRLTWMRDWAGKELAKVLSLCSDSVFGHTTEYLPTAEGMRPFQIEWNAVGQKQESMMVVREVATFVTSAS